MVDGPDDAYTHGNRAARGAIDSGVPRWFRIGDCGFEDCIDADTGLPLAEVTAPAELAEWRQGFVQGFNDEIRAALQSGGIDVDFRPLLMTRAEIQTEFATSLLGVLSPENPLIESPSGDIVLELRAPKPRSKAERSTWIGHRGPTGGRWPQFLLYEEPTPVALGRNGRVLMLKSSLFYMTFDVVTTQILNRYFIASRFDPGA